MHDFLLNFVHTSNSVEATLQSNATSRTVLSTKSNVASTLLPWATMSNKISLQNGNIFEATFDFVEATFDFVAFDNVASTWLLVWTGF